MRFIRAIELVATVVGWSAASSIQKPRNDQLGPGRRGALTARIQLASTLKLLLCFFLQREERYE